MVFCWLTVRSQDPRKKKEKNHLFPKTLFFLVLKIEHRLHAYFIRALSLSYTPSPGTPFLNFSSLGTFLDWGPHQFIVCANQESMLLLSRRQILFISVCLNPTSRIILNEINQPGRSKVLDLSRKNNYKVCITKNEMWVCNEGRKVWKAMTMNTSILSF
jgi:hypothetical protein